jgi:hypothetical protein
MKKMIESITGGYVSSAKVVDGALILSLPDAISPVVWRMDLTSVKSSALEVRDQKDGTFMLTLKTPRDDVTNIAPFTEKAIAVRALMAVSYALEQGQTHSHAHTVKPAAVNTGEIYPARQYAAAPASSEGGATKWVSGIAAVLVLFLLIGVLMHQAPRSNSFAGNGEGFSAASASPPPSATAIAPSTTAAGVAVSADDFLRENNKPR